MSLLSDIAGAAGDTLKVAAIDGLQERAEKQRFARLDSREADRREFEIGRDETNFNRNKKLGDDEYDRNVAREETLYSRAEKENDKRIADEEIKYQVRRGERLGEEALGRDRASASLIAANQREDMQSKIEAVDAEILELTSQLKEDLDPDQRAELESRLAQKEGRRRAWRMPQADQYNTMVSVDATRLMDMMEVAAKKGENELQSFYEEQGVEYTREPRADEGTFRRDVWDYFIGMQNEPGYSRPEQEAAEVNEAGLNQDQATVMAQFDAEDAAKKAEDAYGDEVNWLKKATTSLGMTGKQSPSLSAVQMSPDTASLMTQGQHRKYKLEFAGKHEDLYKTLIAKQGTPEYKQLAKQYNQMVESTGIGKSLPLK